ncbi:DUF4145 domain-containing protein [Pelagibius sp. CAU 1746]|uniref:DUF4145 domain-containing protein n=1 Tax=Pelagibius sp. CAU 1746 TaxID=3140370 RepID=UPI00325B8DE1
MTKAHCNACQGDKNHDVLHEETTSWDEEISEYESIYGSDRYEMLRCRGCESITLRHTSYFSENDEPTVTYYPPAMARPEPDWIGNLTDPFHFGDNPVEELLKEVYTALHNRSRRLAAIGTRSLLEHVMIEKIGDQGSFAKNVEAFKEAGYLSSVQADFLIETLEAGHASTHRAWKPNRNQLNTLMDVTESVVQTVYVLHKKIAELKQQVPPRPKR